MGLEKTDAYDYKGLELENTYHVVRKVAVTKKKRKTFVDIYASYDVYDSGGMPFYTEMIVDDIDDSDDEIISAAYTKLKNKSQFAHVNEKKSDREKSEKEKEKGMK